MARVQGHHIYYSGSPQPGEWVVVLTDWMHNCISTIQRMNSTERNLVLLNNFRLSIDAETIRMHKDLDQKQEKNQDEKE